MPDLVCICGFVAKNHSGLTRHRQRGCRNRRKTMRLDMDEESNEESNEEGDALISRKRSLHLTSSEQESIWRGLNALTPVEADLATNPYTAEVEDTIAEPTSLLYSTALQDRDGRQLDMEAVKLDDESVTVNTKLCSVGMVSTSSSLKTETYIQATQKGAGMPVDGRLEGEDTERLSATHDLLSSQDKQAIYQPFKSREDYGFSCWFTNSRTSKSQINSLLKNADTNPNRRRFSYINADEWQSQVYRIPYGIPDDTWRLESVSIRVEVDGIPEAKCTIYYRDIVAVLRFLLGHRAFQHDLVYAPVRTYNPIGERVYTEMHTGDWWWSKQGEVAEGGTIVPILLASDKTLMTRHRGDLSLWPVYVTIGNLSCATRKSQLRPSLILLGLIPVVKTGKGTGLSPKVQSDLYHTALGIMLEPLEQLTLPGLNIRCADGQIRRCHPIIAGMMADYPEQVLITGVKSGQHCPICQVPPEERENMTIQWPIRTHEYTQQRLYNQQKDPTLNDPMDVHCVRNFAWNHALVNIHSTMMLDILHQLLKGIVMTLIEWLECLIKDVIPVTRKRKGQRQTVAEASAVLQLDERFRQVPSFTGLKEFPRFSSIGQWTGNEQKAIVKQLIAVIAPILQKRAPAALHCARAILDFVTLASYTTHDEATLSYMRQAIYRVDKLKHAFKKYRPIVATNETADDEEDQHHFNIPKLHGITHYEDFIRLYGSAQNYDTCYGEAAHKFLLKEFYIRTNKNRGFEIQILEHNIRRTNMVAMADLLNFRNSRRRTVAEAALDTYITQPTRMKSMWNPLEEGLDVEYMARFGLNPWQWRQAQWVAATQEVGSGDFIDALAVFIRENRKKLDGIRRDSADAIRRERDPSWAKKYYVGLHTSVICWAPDGKDGSNIERLTKLVVRCTPNWREKSKSRQDYVWVQLDPASDDRAKEENEELGREVGQLKAVITVADTERYNEKGRPATYTGAFIEMLRWRNNNEVDPVHGMFEVEPIPQSKAINPRVLGSRRFFEVRSIVRSAHLVPAGREKTVFYVNNFADWDQYNTIYSQDFLLEGIRVADYFMEAN